MSEPCPRNSSYCKGAPAQEPHTCPYSEDVLDDQETLCECCKNCEHECAMDI